MLGNLSFLGFVAATGPEHVSEGEREGEHHTHTHTHMTPPLPMHTLSLSHTHYGPEEDARQRTPRRPGGPRPPPPRGSWRRQSTASRVSISPSPSTASSLLGAKWWRGGKEYIIIDSDPARGPPTSRPRLCWCWSRAALENGRVMVQPFGGREYTPPAVTSRKQASSHQ